LIGSLMGEDNCGTVTFIQSPVAGTPIQSSHNQTHQVSITASDGNGNTADCQVTLTGKDIIDPTFTCPTDQDVALNEDCTFLIPDLISSLVGEDNCGTVTFTQSPVAGTSVSSSHDQVHEVTITAIDGNGNESECILALKAKDIIDPSFTCPTNQDVALDEDCAFLVPDLIGSLMGEDNCGTVTFIQSPVAGTPIQSSHNQTHQVSITASDGNGNTSDCQVTLMTKDIIDPTFTCPTDQDVELNEGCAFLVPDLISGLVGEDNCGTVTFTQSPVVGTSVSSSNDQVHEVLIIANDGNGNTTLCAVILISKDLTPPTISCPEPQELMLDFNCAAILPDYRELLTVGDNCGVTTLVQMPIAGTMVEDTGEIAITFTATDANNNSMSCSLNVIKVDTLTPIIQCFDKTVVFNGEDSIALDENELVDAMDNCGIQEITLSSNSISSNQMGQMVPVLVIVTDQSGNTQSCTSEIDVLGLPSGWSQVADGVGCTNGNDVQYDQGTQIWTINSTNCYYSTPFTADEIGFAQRTLCGNGSITARVLSISGTSLGWAGVTMRETNDPGARKAQLTTNMSNFGRREFRLQTDGASLPQQFMVQNRRWLRIERSGNQFVMYVSGDGVNWFFGGAQNIQMNSCIEIGVVVTNYSSNSTVTAQFSEVSVTGGSALSQAISTNESPVTENQSIRNWGEFRVYPNPTSGEVNIAMTGYKGHPVTIEVYNTLGQLILLKDIENMDRGEVDIDLSSHASGIYLIRSISQGVPSEMKRVSLSK
jgi:hypothetical protein